MRSKTRYVSCFLLVRFEFKIIYILKRMCGRMRKNTLDEKNKFAD